MTLTPIHEYVAKRFPEDTKDHALTIALDEGLHRHLRGQRPNSGAFHFDIVTWPGYLAYTGDMGTYVFTRLTDMFEFFRDNPDRLRHRINPDYWSQKVEAGEIEEFSADAIKRFLRERASEWVDSYEHLAENDEEGRKAAIDEVYTQIKSEIDTDSEYEFHRSLERWENVGPPIEPDPLGSGFGAWDMPSKDYTFRFLWCLHAIVWAIEEYDKQKEA